MALTYEPIATTTLGSSSASITFSSIPSTYTDLRIIFVGTGSSTSSKRLRFNSDSGANYSSMNLTGDGTSATSGGYTSDTSIRWASLLTDSTTIPILGTIDIFSYTGSTYKTVLFNTSSDQNGSGYTLTGVGIWMSTSAITSITLLYNDASTYNTGTIATLYGIKSA